MNTIYTEMMKACIGCGKCTVNCDFLRKYGLTHGLRDLNRLRELSFHCYMCGECERYCPVGINGKAITQAIRIEQAEENAGMPGINGYEKLIEEKVDYLYKNYQHANSRTVLFMGCNFPAYYPESAKRLSRVFQEKYGIGTVYECCGKPVMELGAQKLAQRSIEAIRNRMHRMNVKELVMICPNCYMYLKDQLDIRMVSIFEKLVELGIGEAPGESKMYVFQSCPDRTEGEWLRYIRKFLKDRMEIIEGVQCCGLGGCAKRQEPEIAQGFAEKIVQKNYPAIYTYCASCAGNLSRNGCGNVRHLILEIMGWYGEKPDIYNNGKNRRESKFW